MKTKHVSKPSKTPSLSTRIARYQIGTRFTVQWDVSKPRSKKAIWRLYSGTEIEHLVKKKCKMDHFFHLDYERLRNVPVASPKRKIIERKEEDDD